MTPRRFGFAFGVALFAIAVAVRAAIITLPPEPTVGWVPSCVIIRDWTKVNGPYEAHGVCAMPSRYVTGGMALVDPNSSLGDTTLKLLKAAGSKLCNSFARVPQTVLFQSGPTHGYDYYYVPSTYRIMALTDPNGQVDPNTNLSGDSVVHFFSICE